jgi:hypothetical protein
MMLPIPAGYTIIEDDAGDDDPFGIPVPFRFPEDDHKD